MLSAIRSFAVTLAAGLVLVTLPSSLTAQEAGAGPVAAAEFPDSPQPQLDVAASEPGEQQISEPQTPSGQNQSAQQPAADSTAAPSSVPGSSSSLTPAAQTDAEKTEHEKAEEQLKEQEHQRVAGVMATFNTTTNRNALPLSSGQKFQLFFKSETDPWPFVLSGIVAGLNQASDSEPQWGQGVQGYAKRFGAGYSDSFIGNFFGNAVLTSLLHEDPRYFQKGTGSKARRFLWAASSTVWCKRDKGGWGPNYANVGGNMIGAAIARAYYPASERDVGDTISDGLTVSAEGIVGSEIIEFWPDMSRYMKRKHAEKLARQAAQRDAQNGAHPAPQSAPAAKPANPQN
jgi:hypothetical protein